MSLSHIQLHPDSFGEAKGCENLVITIAHYGAERLGSPVVLSSSDRIYKRRQQNLASFGQQRHPNLHEDIADIMESIE
ncbi:hypothetical protein [Coleofasciculus sp. FACHB-129]|uniref:hypothetical protein n=1 Tax=Cyanophyceae TaxID=3028117 RepID=UPI001684B139|nr:hypothetical protein [Coleofasciculus sp. FACHB-129]MBD1895465.1 hypothetical protein [Coleofasciculus sp. FACHB-129]